MKKQLIAILFLVSSCSINSTTELKTGQCSESSEKFLAKVDENASLCLSFIEETNTPQFTLKRISKNRANWSSVMIIPLSNSRKIVGIIDNKNIDKDNKPIMFYLKGRVFQSWRTSPNEKILNKYQKDINIILNTIDNTQR